MMCILKKRSIVWICILCLLMSGVCISCKKKEKIDDKPTTQNVIEQESEGANIELPEDNLEDETAVADDGKTDTDKTNTNKTDKNASTQNGNDTSKENSKDNSEESQEETPQVPPSSEEDATRDPIVLPAMPLD